MEKELKIISASMSGYQLTNHRQYFCYAMVPCQYWTGEHVAKGMVIAADPDDAKHLFSKQYEVLIRSGYDALPPAFKAVYNFEKITVHPEVVTTTHVALLSDGHVAITHCWHDMQLAHDRWGIGTEFHGTLTLEQLTEHDLDKLSHNSVLTITAAEYQANYADKIALRH